MKLRLLKLRVHAVFAFFVSFLCGMIFMFFLMSLNHDVPLAVNAPRSMEVNHSNPSACVMGEARDNQSNVSILNNRSNLIGNHLSYCDLIKTVNKLGKTLSSSQLHVIDVLHALSQSISPLQFVQIGAHVGGVNASHDDTMAMTRVYGWNGLLVEPNPFLFKELYRRYNSWDNLYFAQIGIGSRDGTMVFYAVSSDIDPETGKSLNGGRARQWFTSQLSTFDARIAKARMRQVPMTPMNVEVNTFPKLIARSDHPIKQPHYILIDTEGYDWKVLSTIDLSHFHPFLLIYEHNKLGADAKKAVDYMLKAGYLCAHQDHQNTVCWRPCSTAEWGELPPNDLSAKLIAKISQNLSKPHSSPLSPPP